jgi:hypothetical protein
MVRSVDQRLNILSNNILRRFKNVNKFVNIIPTSLVTIIQKAGQKISHALSSNLFTARTPFINKFVKVTHSQALTIRRHMTRLITMIHGLIINFDLSLASLITLLFTQTNTMIIKLNFDKVLVLLNASVLQVTNRINKIVNILSLVPLFVTKLVRKITIYTNASTTNLIKTIGKRINMTAGNVFTHILSIGKNVIYSIAQPITLIKNIDKIIPKMNSDNIQRILKGVNKVVILPPMSLVTTFLKAANKLCIDTMGLTFQLVQVSVGKIFYVLFPETITVRRLRDRVNLYLYHPSQVIVTNSMKHTIDFVSRSIVTISTLFKKLVFPKLKAALVEKPLSFGSKVLEKSLFGKLR